MKEKAICIDLTGKSFAYAILDKKGFESHYNITEYERDLAEHFNIYTLQGLITGIMLTIVLMEYFAFILSCQHD